MWRWALRCLIAQPVALLVSVAAASGAFLLVLFFDAVYEGESEKVVAYIRNADADLWVMQSGVDNMHMATSFLADWKLSKIRTLPGVAGVEGVLYLNTVIKSGGSTWFAYLVGLDGEGLQAGPWSVAKGKGSPNEGEVVIPLEFADKAMLRLGDKLQIIDRELEIVGYSEGAFSMANAVVFVTQEDLSDMIGTFGVVSFGLVKAEKGVDLPELVQLIEGEVEKVNVVHRNEFVTNDKTMALQMGVETVALMTLVGGALAIVLVAFTVYTQVARQRRELAVVKALGATNLSLYVGIGIQAIAITLASVSVASALALVIMPMATALVPEISLELTLSAIARVTVIGVVVSLVASMIPTRQIARVDPLSAFHT